MALLTNAKNSSIAVMRLILLQASPRAVLDNFTISVPFLWPELLLGLLFLLYLLVDLCRPQFSQRYGRLLALAGLVAVLIADIWQLWVCTCQMPRELLVGALMLTREAMFFKLLFVVVALLTVWLSKPHTYAAKRGGEYFSLLFALLMGLHLLTMATNWLSLYISLELVSISSYILTVFRLNKQGAEGGLKYLIFGAFASAVMLYGMSWLYGFSGSLQFAHPEFIYGLVQGNRIVVSVALLLALGGLLFKMATVPFHFWTPDAYEAAPTPMVAFFSVAPKAAALAVLIQLQTLLQFPWVQQVLVVLAISSIFLGNLAALRQTNLKRMLAYSSIAHTGYLLIGVLIPVTSNASFAQQAMLFYLVVYLLMNVGAFALVSLLGDADEDAQAYELERYSGLGLQAPLLGVLMLVLMIALTGLPPTAGFSAKLFLFSALWENYQSSGQSLFLWWFVLGLFNTVPALFYYLRVPFYMFFRPAAQPRQLSIQPLDCALLCLLVFGLLLLFVWPQGLMDAIRVLLGQ